MINKDWRLQGQESYLMEVSLKFQSYEPANPKNDHDHCEFCSRKFMKFSNSDSLTEGYTTKDRYRWICKNCFKDFKETFKWKVE